MNLIPAEGLPVKRGILKGFVMLFHKEPSDFPLFKLKSIPFWTYLFVIITYFYSDLPIYHGQIGYDPDLYLRATQILEFLRHGEWFNTLITRIDPPGIDVYSRLGDLPYLALAFPLKLFFEDRTAVEIAVTLVPPLFLLPLYFWLSVWVARPLVGPKWSLLAPIPAIFSATTVVYFGPGQCDHHNLQILLFAVMAGVFIRLISPSFAGEVKKLSLLFSTAAALSLTLSVEGLPFLLYFLAVMALYTLIRKPRTLASFWMIFGLAMPVLTCLLMVATRSPATYFDDILYRASWLSVLIATGCGIVSLSLAYASLRPLSLFWRFGVVSAISLIAGSLALSLAPDLLANGVWSGIPPEIKEWARENTNEMQPLSKDNTYTVILFSFVLPLLLGSIGFLNKTNNPEDTAWARRSMCVLLLALLLLSVFFAARTGRFTAVVYTPAILLCAQYIYRKAGKLKAERPRVIAEITALLLLGPLCGPILSNVVLNRGALDTLFFFPPNYTKGENVLNLGTYLNMKPLDNAEKRILVGLNFGTELAFRSHHIFLGTGQQYTTASGLNILKKFYTATTDHDAAKVIAGNNIDYILYVESEMDAFRKVLKLPADNNIVIGAKSDCGSKMSPTPDMLTRLKYGDYPDFLRQVELPFGGTTLLSVDKDKLAHALKTSDQKM